MQGGAEDIKKGTEVQEQDGCCMLTQISFLYLLSLYYSGIPKTCLTEPHSIVLSEDAAKKYFATTDAVGKVMMVKEDSHICSLQSNGCCKTLPAKFFHTI